MSNAAPTLFDFPALRPLVKIETRTIVAVAGRDDTSSLQDQFERFHVANEWVYELLVRLARDLIEHGARKVGMGMLFEVVRWQYARATTDAASDFKVNNSYRSRYARLVMEREPDLAGMFDVRELRA